MIKKIFCDIDGTLITSQGVLTKNTIEKIKQLKARNIDFIITTGRPIAGLQYIFDQYGDYLSCICCLGADYHNDKGERIYDFPIDKQAAKQIYDLQQECQNNGLSVFAKDDMYVCRELEKVLFDTYGITEVPKTGPISQWMKGVHYVDNVDYLLNSTIYKMEYYTKAPEQCQILLNKLKQIKNINPCPATNINVEITASNVSKGEMIKQICQKENISLDEVVTIGDSGNDLSMLLGFKHSIAMANATEDIKQICKHTTLDNNHEGVAEVIDKILKADHSYE